MGRPVEAAMRYAWIGVLLLLTGCASFPPVAIDSPRAALHD